MAMNRPTYLCLQLVLLLLLTVAISGFVVAEGGQEPEVETDDRRTGRQILVFGGNGFLGASTVHRLIQLGDHVTLVNRGNWYWDSKDRVGSSVQTISCDRKNGIASCSDLIQLINSVEKFDAVVDFSAYGSQETLDATSLLRTKVNIYIHISTDSIYDVCDTDGPRNLGPLREVDAIRPSDPYLREMLSSHHDYGHRKLQAEEVLVEQRNNVSDVNGTVRGIPYVIFRLPDVLGPRDTTYRFWIYQLWIRLAPLLPSRPVSIPQFLVDYNNSFVYVDDVAEAIVSVIDRSTDATWAASSNKSFIDEAFNLAWPQNITLEQLLRDIEAALGMSPQQQFQKDDAAASLYLYPTVRRGPVSVQKVSEVLDWKPTAWGSAINATVQFYETAMTDPRWKVQRDEIIQIQISQLYSDMKEEFLDVVEKVYGIDLSHFRPHRDEL
jgi:nucleoside-diphosphate-sugar epimerase